MRTAFVWTVGVAIIMSIVAIRRFVKIEKKSSIRWLRRVLIAASTAECGCLLIAAAHSYVEAFWGYGLYYASIDWILFFLILYVREYINGENNRFTRSQVFIYLALVIVDSTQLLVNTYTNHAFYLHVIFYNLTKEMFYMPHFLWPYQCHLALSYMATLTLMIILAREIIKTKSYYRRKFIAILSIVGLIVAINAVYLLFEFPLDWSVILYSICCIVLEYFATRYTPRHLRISVLGDTVYNFGEGLIIFDIYDKCIYTNKMAQEMFGIDTESLTLDSYPVTEWLRGLSIRNAFPIDAYYDIDSNRELIRYRLQLKQITSPQGDYLGSYFQIDDVTKEYKSMLAIQEARRKEEKARIEASRANRAKSDFLANMSHEIRTPINAVLGMNEMILREDISPEVREFANNIATSGEALLSIVNDILDFSKIESGKMELHRVEYSPHGVIKSCETMILPRASAKNLELIIECDETCPKCLYGDEIRVRQILTNILTNAVKYTEKGSVKLSLKWNYKREKDGEIILTVSDTGIGIARENQSKLFDAFERIEERRNRNIEGTGLGLSITSQLVKLMGGKIDVESEYGKGSTFTVTIPQGVIDTTPSGVYGAQKAENASKYQALFKAPEARILAVDDYKMNLTVLKGLLKKTEVRLTLASSGNEALEKANEETFHLILMDHMMPGMDGIEALEKIRKGDGPNKDTPVIMLTANAISGAEEQYMKAGFQGYLSKPINSKALEEHLYKYIPDELIVKE